jgi:hypothetical protein
MTKRHQARSPPNTKWNWDGLANSRAGEHTPRRKDRLRSLPVEAPEVGQMLAYTGICRIGPGNLKFNRLRDLLDLSESHLLAPDDMSVNISAIRNPGLF